MNMKLLEKVTVAVFVSLMFANVALAAAAFALDSFGFAIFQLFLLAVNYNTLQRIRRSAETRKVIEAEIAELNKRQLKINELTNNTENSEKENK